MDGRNKALKYKPAPFGDIQLRCKRPRPAVCSSETTQSPSVAPCAAKRAASVFVEGKDSYRMTWGLKRLIEAKLIVSFKLKV